MMGAEGKVRMQGVYEYLVLESETIDYEERWIFDAVKEDCRWRIAYQILSSSRQEYSSAYGRSVGTCDGTNVYVVKHFNRQEMPEVSGWHHGQVSPQHPVADAVIYPGTVPPPREWTVFTLWFGLASDCVLGAPTGRSPAVFFMDLARFYECADCWLDYFRSNAPGDPGREWIVLRNPGYEITRDHRTDWRIIRYPQLAPYDKGYVAGVGEWRGIHYVDDQKVPLSFVYNGYLARGRLVGGRGRHAEIERVLENVVRFSCVVTQVSRADLGECPMPLPVGRVLVQDRRLAREGWAYVKYTVTDGRWWTMEELRNYAPAWPRMSLEEEARLMLAGPPERPERRLLRPVLYMLVGLPLFFWAVGWFLRRKRGVGSGAEEQLPG